MQAVHLYGYQKIEKAVLSDFINNKLHHSLLIKGPKGIGKACFAYKLANRILSITNDKNLFSIRENPNDWFVEQISVESPTFRLIESVSHPDFLIIKPEMNFKTHKLDKEIKVDLVRKIKDFVILTPSLSKYKVVIVDDADKMNLNAQNAILKVLEEPNKNTFIILVSHNASKMLPTVISRCRAIDINRLSYNDWK